MTTALVYLGGSTLALLLLSFFYGLEDRRGHRVVLRRLRAGLDLALHFLVRRIRLYARHAWQTVVRYVLHHGVQWLLRHTLRTVQRIEAWAERRLRAHRTSGPGRTDRPRTHLDELRAFKVSTREGRRSSGDEE